MKFISNNGQYRCDEKKEKKNLLKMSDKCNEAIIIDLIEILK